jgi:hypothetical protein
MDEIDNDVLPVLLLLDDNLFPQLLEWSASKGWADLVMFLLQADYLRFKSNDIFESDNERVSMFEPYHLIAKNSCGCFDKFFSPEKLASLKRLLDSGVPLNGVYSQICLNIWKDMLMRGRQIINSNVWPSVRRCIVENHEVTIEDMLDDLAKRKYFDRFIQRDECDLAALQCLLSVRRILKTLERYTVKSTDTNGASGNGVGGTSNGTSNEKGDVSSLKSKFFGAFSMFSSINDDNNPSIMRRFGGASKKSVQSASKALQAPYAAGQNGVSSNNMGGGGSSGGGIATGIASSNGSINAAMQHTSEYTDPFEAFKIVLEGMRQLQKQYFPTSTNPNRPTGGTTASGSNTASYGSATAASLGGGGANARRLDSSNGYSSSSPHGSQASDSSTSSPVFRSVAGDKDRGGEQLPYVLRNCSGISETLRIEIQSTLTVNASVRAREIETVDRAFAFACANILERQLLLLQEEMMVCIKAIFEEFKETTDFALMVAHTRSLECKRITDYAAKLEFLYDRVRQLKIVSWKDSQTKGII